MLLPPTDPKADRSVKITLDEAVNLLLKSIAMEESSLSKLLEIEQGKVLTALSQCRCGTAALRGGLEVNRSVEEMVQTITQLQTLLQLKLKQAEVLCPCNTPSTCPWLPETCHGPGCSVVGEGKGIVGNTDDSYCHLPVSVYTFFPCGDRKNGTFRYRIGDSCRGLHLYACDRNVTLHCPSDGSHQIVVDGAGRVKVYGDQEPEQAGTASFTLTVDQGETGTLTFRMELIGRGALCLNHDSGWVKVDNQRPHLRIKRCERGNVAKYM